MSTANRPHSVAAAEALGEVDLAGRRRGRATTARGWRDLACVSFASYACLTTVVVAAALRLNHGTFVYGLDDPYIHLAVAKTWLNSGTLGVSPGEFAPASSSPVWTVLLTIVSAVVGTSDFAPLALNIAAAAGSIAVFWWGLARLSSEGQWASVASQRGWRIAAAALPLLMNLPGLTICGMEHGLHAMLTLAFTVVVWTSLERPRVSRSALALAALLPLVRLEATFTIAVAAWLFVRRGRTVPALLLVVSAALPVVAMGFYFLSRGAFFLPNSVVAKAVPPTLSGWLEKWATTDFEIAIEPFLLGVVVACASLRRTTRTESEGFSYVLAIMTLHFALATVGGIGWLDRYETYLVELGLFFIALHLVRQGRTLSLALPPDATRGPRIARVLAIVGMGERVGLLVAAAVASNDIYLQQFQMGRFIQRYFPHGSVVANDIGVVSLRAGGTVTDLAGLGSTDVLRLLRRLPHPNLLSDATVRPILERNGADCIVIYPEWFTPALYGNWLRVAEWSIGRRPMTAAHRNVVFFAIDEARRRELDERLRAFDALLPPQVRVTHTEGR